MKPKNNNGLHKAELTTTELQLLVEYYNQAVDESDGVKSPLLKAQREELMARSVELQRMFDGRWTNRGKGRKPKPADPAPELPLAPTQPGAAVNDLDA